MRCRFSLPGSRARLCVVALFYLFPAFSALARAQSDAGSSKLASVKVIGSKKYTSELIAPETGLSPGATITKADLQNGADRLAQLGLFSNVQYRFSTEDAGVRLEYQVTDAPALPVRFDNFPWFTDEELFAALKKEIPFFDGTAPENGSMLHEMTNSLERLLATRGVNSSVSNAVVTAPVTDRRVQQFRVENAGANIASLDFGDALARDDRGIQQRLVDVVGKPYSRTVVELFEFEQLRPVYLAHGFLRVRFPDPSPRITGAASAAKVVVAAPIEPGPQFAWSGITWSGNSTVSTSVLNTDITVKPGDPVDGMKLEAMWDAARGEYSKAGYLDMSLTAIPKFDDSSKRVTYDVAINEGPQYRMGKLVLTGLSVEGERRIRAAWGIAPGAVFNKDIYEEFAASGIKAAFVGLPFHYEKVGRFLQEDAAKGVVDVLIDFQ
jgi:outer membrane protein assembly factor BamA